MPEEGDGAACPVALPSEEWWVPHLVALVRQRAKDDMGTKEEVKPNFRTPPR
jgi:hypothetical protein